MARGSGVRAAGKSRVLVSFSYRGVRYREKLKLPPTPPNLKYAQQLKATVEREIALGIFDFAKHFPDSKRALKVSATPGAAMTVAELLKQWLPTVRDEMEPETWKKHDEARRGQLARWFGTMRLTEVTRAVLKARIATEGDLSRKRLLNLLTPLRQAFDFAVDAGYLPASPFTGLKIRRVASLKEEVIEPFTPQEIAAVVPKLSEPLANMATFWVWTGLRFGELVGLTWADVDFARGVVRINKARRGRRVKAPKTTAGTREVRLLPPAHEALMRQRAHSQLIGQEVFLNPKTQKPWIGDKPVRNIWRAALKEAGVKYRFPRQCRHTFASWMLSAGESPLWVARMMGHRDWSQIVRTYGKWIPDVDPQAGMRAVAAVTGTAVA